MAPKKSLAIQYVDTVMYEVQIGKPITSITASWHYTITVFVITRGTYIFCFSIIIVDPPPSGISIIHFVFFAKITSFDFR